MGLYTRTKEADRQALEKLMEATRQPRNGKQCALEGRSIVRQRG